MNEFHGLLTLTVFLPATFALLIGALGAASPKTSGQAIKVLTLAGTLITLALSVFLYTQYNPDPHAPQFQIVDKTSWIPSLHINYFLGMDGISLLMVLMTTLIFPFVVGVSFKEDRKSVV